VYTKDSSYLLVLGVDRMLFLSLKAQEKSKKWDWRKNCSVFVLCWVILSPWTTLAAQLTLTWNDNANSETGFRVERRTEGSSEYQWIAALDANVTSYIDVSVAGGKSYCYRVQAYSPLGTSDYSNEACAVASTLLLGFESPEIDQAVSGIGTIRGWAFDTIAGGKVQHVELFVDGALVGDIPCCSPRGDVQATFSQFPADNTANSGWGTGINWGELTPGSHIVQIKAQSSSGEILASETRTVKVIRPGTSSFVDVFSLARASTQIDGQDLILQNVSVRDKATQQQNDVTATFRWFTNSQAFGMTQAFTVTNVASSQSVLFARAVSGMQQWWNDSTFGVSSAYAAPKIVTLIESPDNGQAVFGINVLRGWAFDEDPKATVHTIRLTVDDTPVTVIPCCSGRGDVAATFPKNPNAGNSGWGITFNSANLPAGPHAIGVQIESSAGALVSQSRQVTVVKLGGFEFIDLVDFTDATARIEGEDIVVSGVHIRDFVSQQTTTVQLRLRWSVNSQSLGVISIG